MYIEFGHHKFTLFLKTHFFAAAKALSSDARTEEQKVDDLRFVSTRVKLFKYILEGRLQKLNTCLSVEPGPIRLVCKTTTEFKRTLLVTGESFNVKI